MEKVKVKSVPLKKPKYLMIVDDVGTKMTELGLWVTDKYKYYIELKDNSGQSYLVLRNYWDKPNRKRNKMPLASSERKVLAELHGRAKKYYVKQLKAKYA